MKYGNIFWGVILIALGVLFALRNFDIFFFSWHSILRLWPLIFVFWGIAILPVKSLVKIVLTALTVVVAIVILSKDPGHHHRFFNWKIDRHSYESDKEEYPWEKQYLSEELNDQVKYARLNLDAAAGDFQLSGTTSMLYEFENEGNTGPYRANVKQTDEQIDINITHEKIIRRGEISSDVWLSLNPYPVWNLNIDVGAAKIELDLSSFKVESVDIDGGASSVEIRLGSNLNIIDVNIDAGASAIKIFVPYESACEVHTSTILSSKELDGFNKISKGLYQTSNFSDSANQIFIRIDAAVAGLKIERY